MPAFRRARRCKARPGGDRYPGRVHASENPGEAPNSRINREDKNNSIQTEELEKDGELKEAAGFWQANQGRYRSYRPLGVYFPFLSPASFDLNMAHFPTPPASRHGSRSPDVDSKNAPLADSSAELLQSLDSLLERYLDLVDRHEKLHAELAKRLSSV